MHFSEKNKTLNSTDKFKQNSTFFGLNFKTNKLKFKTLIRISQFRLEMFAVKI